MHTAIIKFAPITTKQSRRFFVADGFLKVVSSTSTALADIALRANDLDKVAALEDQVRIRKEMAE